MNPLPTKRKRPSFRPHMELLEDRAVPAGNVLASQLGPTLSLLGDQLANNILIRSGNLPNEVVVQGLNTTLNGANQTLTFQGVQHILASLGDGDDWFQTVDLTLSAVNSAVTDLSLQVNGEGGDNRIELVKTTLEAGPGPSGAASIAIVGSGQVIGNDTIRLTDTSVIGNFAQVLIFGDATFGDASRGNDSISVTDSSVSGIQLAEVILFGDNLQSFNETIIGDGNDSISISNTTVTARDAAIIHISGEWGFGEDRSTIPATIAGGNDSISISKTNVSATNAVLDISGNSLFTHAAPITIAGNDSISVTNTTVAGTGFAHLVISDEDAGDDRVLLRHVEVTGPAAQVDVNTGNGNDTLEVLNSVFRTFRADIAEGDDLVRFNHNLFEIAFFDGWGGYDELSAHNNAGNLTWLNFEKVKVTP